MGRSLLTSPVSFVIPLGRTTLLGGFWFFLQFSFRKSIGDGSRTSVLDDPWIFSIPLIEWILISPS